MTSRTRTTAAIAAIVVCAVAAIVVAAIVIPGRSGPRAAAPAPPPLPDLAPLILDAADVQRAGQLPLQIALVENGLSRPPGSTYQTNPPGCTAVAKPGQAAVYAPYPWLKARRAVYDATVLSLNVFSSVVVMRSDEIAASFVDQIGKKWQSCESMQYQNGSGDISTFTVAKVDVGSGRLTATITNLPPIECRHVMAVKKAFVVEVMSCGTPPVDVDKVVDATMALVPN